MHSVAARVAWRYSWRDGVERHKFKKYVHQIVTPTPWNAT